jgi:DNA (cytosine-5)-methyltransferase 1
VSATSTHLFCGGFGDGLGFHRAGFSPVFAANHDAASVATVRANFSGVRVRLCDIANLDFRSVPRTDVLVGSPICTEVSPEGRNATPRRQLCLDEAGDDRPAEQEFARTRATAWDLLRADEVHDYDVVCGENVVDFVTRWRPFGAWLRVWDALGKNVQVASVNAAHIGVEDNDTAPQHRNRVIWCFSKRGLPLPDLRVRPACVCLECGPVRGVQQWGRRFDAVGARKVGVYGKQYRYVCPTRGCHRVVEPVTRPIGEHIDWTVRGHRFGDGRQDRKTLTPYQPATRRRVEIGLDRFDGAPFIVILRKNCTVQSVDEPVSTITTGNHHWLVRPGSSVDDCEIRQLTVRERARAQHFPDTHKFMGDSEEHHKRQVGNAVPVNVAHWHGERVRAVWA